MTKSFYDIILAWCDLIGLYVQLWIWKFTVSFRRPLLSKKSVSLSAEAGVSAHYFSFPVVLENKHPKNVEKRDETVVRKQVLYTLFPSACLYHCQRFELHAWISVVQNMCWLSARILARLHEQCQCQHRRKSCFQLPGIKFIKPLLGCFIGSFKMKKVAHLLESILTPDSNPTSKSLTDNFNWNNFFIFSEVILSQ